MSFELHSHTGERFVFSSHGWGYYLDLAERYGWPAAGTLQPEGMPDPDRWEKAYCENSGQWVSDADAQALAKALEAALGDPRRVERLTMAAKAESERLTQATGRSCRVRAETGDEAYIGEMIEFFKKGRFKIW